MNRTSSIKQICHDRGIKILVHFTHIENLRRILGEGLLSRETLVHLGKRNWSYQFDLRLSLRHGLSRNPEGFDVHFYMSQDLRHDALETIRDPLKKKPIFNDPNRLDKHPEAICLSIGFPNYKMFYRYRSKNPSQWVVLLPDEKLELRDDFAEKLNQSLVNMEAGGKTVTAEIVAERPGLNS